MAPLTDQYGVPMKKALLKQEIAAPTVSGVRSIITGHPAQGLTPGRLTSILREAENGDPLTYFELAEEMEEKDPRYLTVLNTRKNQVSQLDISVEPASDAKTDLRNAELVERFLDRDELQPELFDMLDAIGKGISVTEIIWDTSRTPWLPKRLEWVDPRFIEFDRTDGRTPLLKGEGLAQPLAPGKFIVHHAKVKSGLPIRGGLARAVSWWYLFRNYSVKDWLTFMEVYGQPLRVGKYDKDATDDEKDVLLRALTQIGSDAAAMIPANMVIDFVKAEGASASNDAYQKFNDYIDKLITLLVLGQNLTTDVQSGSLAAANVHDGVKDDIESADATQLAATLNRDLVRPLIDLNYGPQEWYPKIKIGRPEPVDLQLISSALTPFIDRGLPIATRHIYEVFGIDAPEADDELLKPSGRSQPGIDGSDTQQPRQQGGKRADKALPSEDPADDAEPEDEDEAAAAAHEHGDDDLTAFDRVIEQAERAGEPELTAWIEQIRKMIMEADSIEQVQAQLLPMLASLDLSGMVTRLSESLVLADLFGRDTEN